MNGKNEVNAVYIDFRVALNLLRRKIVSLVLTGLVGALLFGAVGSIIYTPMYSSSVSFIVHADQSVPSQLTPYDITYSEKLINTLEVLLKYNNSFRTRLNSMAGTSEVYTDEDILEMMDISQIKKSSSTMNVTFTSTSRNDAYNLAKCFELLVNDELERLNVSVGFLEVINSAEYADLPDNTNNTLSYVLAGFILSFAVLYVIFLVMFYFDTKIHSEEDISDLLEYPILGSVPSIKRSSKIFKKRSRFQ